MDTQQRAEIITYARKTIVHTGVKSLRMDDIAQAVRVSKRTLYETFGDKEELLFLAAKEHFDIFDQSNMEAAREAESNVLIAMIIVMGEIRKNAEVNWHIRSTLKRFFPKVNERLQNDKSDLKRKVVADTIKLGIKQGYIDSRINVEFTINIFNYIAIGISENNEMLKIPEDMKVNDAFQEVLISFLRGIGTIKGVESIDDFLAKQQNNNI